MIQIKLQKGYDPRMAGKPEQELEPCLDFTEIGVSPRLIPFIKPRLKIKEGDHVKIGSVLFEDKRSPDIKFLSPASGVIQAVQFGDRRVIDAIVIKIDANEEAEHFPFHNDATLDRLDRRQLIDLLLMGGVWPLIRSLPFRDIAPLNQETGKIIVRLANKEPFHPQPSLYLKDKKDLFNFGLRILKKIAAKVIITTVDGQTSGIAEIDSQIAYSVNGLYPACDPGVFLYRTRHDPSDNRSWFVDGQDLLFIAELVKNGTFPTQRLIAVGGTAATKAGFILTRVGAPLSQIIQTQSNEKDITLLMGGIFHGHAAGSGAYLGFFEKSILALPNGQQDEMFGFLNPGYKKRTFSRTFLSIFNPSPLPLDTGRHGEERACINCGTCAKICPVEILPQFLMKSLVADDIEEALQHGLLDCLECGLCTFCCPSKIELGNYFKTAKMNYYRENVSV